MASRAHDVCEKGQLVFEGRVLGVSGAYCASWEGALSLDEGNEAQGGENGGLHVDGLNFCGKSDW